MVNPEFISFQQLFVGHQDEYADDVYLFSYNDEYDIFICKQQSLLVARYNEDDDSQYVLCWQNTMDLYAPAIIKELFRIAYKAKFLEDHPVLGAPKNHEVKDPSISPNSKSLIHTIIQKLNKKGK